MKRAGIWLSVVALVTSASACSSRPVELLGTLAGTVTVASPSPSADGPSVPARGATVVLAGLERATEVDETGAFSFDAVPLGAVRLVITAPATRESVKLIDYTLDGGAAPIAITLLGTAQLVGTVRDKAGEPLSGAHVTMATDGTATLTDGAGHFELRGSIGTTSLFVAKEGYDPAVSPALTLAWNQATTFDASLTQTFTLSQVDGVVRRAGQTQHAGIFVRLAGTMHGAVTDEAGKFRLHDVPNGLYTLELADHTIDGQERLDVVENVMLSGGTLFRFTNQLETLPPLELLPGRRIGSGLEQSVRRLNPELALLAKDGGYRVVGRDGVERFVGERWDGLSTSIAPAGNRLYDEGAPSTTGARRGRVVDLLAGTATNVGDLASPFAWANDDVLIATVWRPDDKSAIHLAHIDAMSGTETELPSLANVGQRLIPVTGAPIFFASSGSAVERRNLADGELLDQREGSNWCAPYGCFTQASYGASYRAYYPDGAVIDTSIPYAVPSSAGYPYSTQLLFGQERFYASAQRQSHPLPAVTKALLASTSASSLRTSTRGTWFWSQTDGLSLFRVDATGATELFATTAAATPTSFGGWQVSIALDESAAMWSAVLANGLRMTYFASKAGGATAIDCDGCEPLLVNQYGAILASGFGATRALYRYVPGNSVGGAGSTVSLGITTTVSSFTPQSPEGTRFVVTALDGEVSIVTFATGEKNVIGHGVSPSAWLDERTVIVQRGGAQPGQYLVELP